ncbi:MAG TPA: GDSL-type esterase/lipase family protein [Thermomicrobiales bacterium]|nr:GDSL-type esterase/lipase family protein [Thermomicrobiales bacterium]
MSDERRATSDEHRGRGLPACPPARLPDSFCRLPPAVCRLMLALLVALVVIPGTAGAQRAGGAALAATPGASPTAVRPAPGPPPVGIGQLYLALGDSLGVGLLASLPDERGYVPLLRNLLQQDAGRPLLLQNLSVSGETAATMLSGKQLADALDAIKTAHANGWQVSPITLDIGGNDMQALLDKDEAAREAGLATFRANYAQILDRLVAATTVNGARASDIVTMTVYNPYGGDPALAHSPAWWVQRFNGVIADEAAKRGVRVADVYDPFRGHETDYTYMPLDFHPNNRGHEVIAEAFWRTMGYDTAPPALDLLAPASGPLPRDVPTIKIRASDNVGVTAVTATLDGRPLPDPLYEPQFGLYIGYWDARQAPPGPHTLTVTAADEAGNTTTRTVTLTR